MIEPKKEGCKGNLDDSITCFHIRVDTQGIGNIAGREKRYCLHISSDWAIILNIDASSLDLYLDMSLTVIV